MDDRRHYCGVNIFMMYLILSLVDPDRRMVATTQEVCEAVVKRRTKQHSDAGYGDCSFADLVGYGVIVTREGVQVPDMGVGMGMGSMGGGGGRAMARETADVFVSHAWGDPFIQVIAAIDVSSPSRQIT